ncbi:MAG TPA: ACP S-malonyltransferase [Thermoleophilaceae bacterium]|nr:ACP S-malonyltransferase [Thermoleophilaceae bacterium]
MKVVSKMDVPTASTTAALFPGQGSQTPELRALVAELRPDLLELAAVACGCDPFERVEQGTRYQQPAIFCASLAGWERARLEAPAVLAGHSLGELAALTAAGVLDEPDALRIVVLRGQAMDEAARHGPVGGMLALRADGTTAAAIARSSGLAIANENSPSQVVLAGSLAALARAEEESRECGVRAVRLPVSGAFHSPAMAPAAAPLRAALAEVAVRPPQTPVLSCMTATPFEDPRAELVAALTRPVRWLAVLRALEWRGIDRFVETGPGGVLTKLARQVVPAAEALTVDVPEAARA